MEDRFIFCKVKLEFPVLKNTLQNTVLANSSTAHQKMRAFENNDIFIGRSEEGNKNA